MDRFNKSDVVNRVVEARPNTMTKAETGIVLSLALDWIAATVAAGNKVVIKGFGTFEPRQRAERMGRNPRTGEEVLIPASSTMGFKPAKVRAED